VAELSVKLGTPHQVISQAGLTAWGGAEGLHRADSTASSTWRYVAKSHAYFGRTAAAIC